MMKMSSLMGYSLKKNLFSWLFVFIVVTCLLLIMISLTMPNSVERDDRALIRTEVRNILQEQTHKLDERVRFLEEDSLFRSQGREKRPLTGLGRKYPPVKKLTEAERKRILITGGCGFVGSHLVDRLLRDGHEVSVADNFFTGRRKNVEHWIGHENFELLNHDIIIPLMLEVDQIYHLASPASPVKYMYNPVKTIKTNTIGTLNMLGLAKRVKARFLMASTSEVYGDPKIHPQHEEYWGHVNPIGPRACYDEGKRVAETMVYAYANQDNVDVRVARIFNTYGPRMHMFDGRVVSNFIIQALQGKPLTVISPGNQTRSFMFVSDLVNGLIALMNSNYTKPVNLGNPDEYSILDFAQLVQKFVGNSTGIKMLPYNQDDPHRRRPDITRALKVLNWRPIVSLEDGIKRTVSYFKNELGNSTSRVRTRT